VSARLACLFPNWPLTKAAEFHTLRAVGSFLVSAACSDGVVQWVRIVSEAGTPLKLVSPRQPKVIIDWTTVPGGVITLTKE
jgi:alpha-L-fucosidase 2